MVKKLDLVRSKNSSNSVLARWNMNCPESCGPQKFRPAANWKLRNVK